jgi:hypothetical protein
MIGVEPSEPLVPVLCSSLSERSVDPVCGATEDGKASEPINLSYR